MIEIVFSVLSLPTLSEMHYVELRSVPRASNHPQLTDGCPIPMASMIQHKALKKLSAISQPNTKGISVLVVFTSWLVSNLLLIYE